MVDASGNGEDAVCLLIRNSEGMNALGRGGRICRIGDDLFRAGCEQSAGKEGTERRAGLDEKNAERVEAAQRAPGRSCGISA